MAHEQPQKKRRSIGRFFAWLGRLLAWSSAAYLSIILAGRYPVPLSLLPVLVVLATEVFILQRRRAAADIQRLKGELQLAIRRGPAVRTYRLALEPRERVDFKIVERAIAHCDVGEFEQAVDLLLENKSPAVNYDFSALYVRGFAHFNMGARKQALKDLNSSLDCLLFDQGVVESAMAALYLAQGQWKEGRAAAQRSIDHMDPSPHRNRERTCRARRWVPYIYMATIHELTGNVKSAKDVLTRMASQVPEDRDVASFLEHHPFLTEAVKLANSDKEFQSWTRRSAGLES